jgi:hypothetical protein
MIRTCDQQVLELKKMPLDGVIQTVELTENQRKATRHPRLHRLLDLPDLLGGWPAATALNRSNHFNAGREPF